MRKIVIIFLILFFSVPNLVVAQSNRYEELRGNRKILTVEEAENIGKEPETSKNDTALAVLAIVVFLGAAGYAAVQLAGMKQKPKMKK